MHIYIYSYSKSNGKYRVNFQVSDEKYPSPNAAEELNICHISVQGQIYILKVWHSQKKKKSSKLIPNTSNAKQHSLYMMCHLSLNMSGFEEEKKKETGKKTCAHLQTTVAIYK